MKCSLIAHGVTTHYFIRKRFTRRGVFDRIVAALAGDRAASTAQAGGLAAYP